ncbi:hypothetical protein AMTRI_Chr10g6550 [Amborella trichopoda]
MEEDDITAIDKSVSELRSWLLRTMSKRGVLSLMGMGGAGKTTLAKRVYNSLKSSFTSSAWVTVSQTFRIVDILESIIKEFGVISTERSSNETERELPSRRLNYLNNHVREERFLVVFDDVWQAEVQNLVDFFLPEYDNGSRIIITTHLKGVANVVNTVSCIYELKSMEDSEAFDLFGKKAFQHDRMCPDELRDLADGLVEKCGGLPLAIVAMGGIMSRKPLTYLEWSRVLEDHQWEIHEGGGQVSHVLSFSYNDLPLHLKSCFLYCSLFLEDYEQ